jgi:Gas vesicle synthesis protein GvpL/GvpF
MSDHGLIILGIARDSVGALQFVLRSSAMPMADHAGAHAADLQAHHAEVVDWARCGPFLPAGHKQKLTAHLEMALTAQELQISAALEQTRQAIEINVRLKALVPKADNAPDGHSKDRHSPVPANTRGRAFLQARAVEMAMTERSGQALLDMIARCRTLAESHGAIMTLAHVGDSAEIALLVARSNAATLASAVENLGNCASCQIGVSGPWPAYRFAGTLFAALDHAAEPSRRAA